MVHNVRTEHFLRTALLWNYPNINLDLNLIFSISQRKDLGRWPKNGWTVPERGYDDVYGLEVEEDDAILREIIVEVS